MLKLDSVHKGNCIELLGDLDEGCVDLVFADPPFNIGYNYDTYDDRVEYDRYYQWSHDWMAACKRVLKPTGSFYIAIGDEYAAEIRMIGRALDLHLRNWIIWHYTFGQNTRLKFARAHTHIFYFVMDPTRFTFNDLQVRVPSARHTEYSDKRADPLGKMPDDVWNEFPRVCGTFSERQGWHGCQMPESLLQRIIRVSSNPGELVVDPFSGSGTTVVTAAKLGRRYVGIDISTKYVKQALSRLEGVPASSGRNGDWSDLDMDTLASLYRETQTARPRLVANTVAMTCFTRLLSERLGRRVKNEDAAAMLAELERQSRLPRLRNDRPFSPRKNGHVGRPRRRRRDDAEATLFSSAD